MGYAGSEHARITRRHVTTYRRHCLPNFMKGGQPVVPRNDTAVASVKRQIANRLPKRAMRCGGGGMKNAVLAKGGSDFRCAASRFHDLGGLSALKKGVLWMAVNH
jgi:hypothetical protein